MFDNLFSGFSLKDMLPKSFTIKNGLVVLCKHIEDHENVGHEVRKFVLSIVTATKSFNVLIYHPGTKKPKYMNDIQNMSTGLYHPVKYELPGYGHMYNFPEGEFMINMIKSLVEKERPDIKDSGMTVDKVEVTYDDSANEIPCDIFVTQSDGKKFKIKHVIK